MNGIGMMAYWGPGLVSVLFFTGFAVGAALISGLLATLVCPALRFWPTPGAKTWQSYLWWPLFRGLNMICFAMAVTERDATAALSLRSWARSLALAALIASIAAFLYAFFKLGRDNSYGARDGLVTSGIYQWSRNPQNAMLMVVYTCLAVATDTPRTVLLCAAMIAVYFLMVLAEEPWLEKAYGDSYRAYCSQVPRFFKFRRLLAT